MKSDIKGIFDALDAAGWGGVFETFRSKTINGEYRTVEWEHDGGVFSGGITGKGRDEFTSARDHWYSTHVIKFHEGLSGEVGDFNYLIRLTSDTTVPWRVSTGPTKYLSDQTTKVQGFGFDKIRAEYIKTIQDHLKTIDPEVKF